MTSTHFDSKSFLKTLTGRPGVYRMLGADNEVLYVGKAQNLKKRFASYFGKVSSPKVQALVEQIHGVEVTVTHTENEALILENNLIKQFKPRYNILLRDDKSYPFLFISSEDEFPRAAIHRGPKRMKGRYFGPYPSVGTARESLNLLQKLFRIRQCEDSFFRTRSRPCLQYQIRRCTAPCVGLIDSIAYREDVRFVEMFLEGKNPQVIDELAGQMEQASSAMEFERAAHFRDRIVSLRRIQERQYVSGEGGDLDVIASLTRNGVGCVQIFYIRDGRNLGNKLFFPRAPGDPTDVEILEAFIPQYYFATANEPAKEIPSEILINHPLAELALLQQELSREADRKVTLSPQVRGERARWVAMAVTNTEHALVQHLASKGTMRRRFEALQAQLGLGYLPERLECFDISHTMGEATVASCVVFDTEGPLKSDYRRFNIDGVTPGDDYAAIKQALLRRYKRLKQGEGKLPDILFIDGGKGQVTQAINVLEELQISDVTIIGIAKGPERRPGMEILFPSTDLSAGDAMIASPVILASDSPALHLIQQIRDEAHRFAITAHRQRRAKARTTSSLEDIPGMGPQRRRKLLSQFGGLREVARAGIEDLAKVQGINKKLAQKIYDTFHSD